MARGDGESRQDRMRREDREHSRSEAKLADAQGTPENASVAEERRQGRLRRLLGIDRAREEERTRTAARVVEQLAVAEKERLFRQARAEAEAVAAERARVAEEDRRLRERDESLRQDREDQLRRQNPDRYP